MKQKDMSTILESLKSRFLCDRAEGWISLIHFHFEDARPLTFQIEHSELCITEGLEGEPLSEVHTDVETFHKLFTGRMPLELALMQNRLKTDNLIEIFKLQTVFEKEAS